MSKFI